MTTAIIGIDCATDAKKVGLAFGELTPDGLLVRQVLIGNLAKPSIHEKLAHWISESASVLLAFDAPLGWPVGLRRALEDHLAGSPIPVEANPMFRRSTDQFVKSETGKTPLDVGADRIARTAHSALALLQKTRESAGHDIPLAWSPLSLTGIDAIEVYPALTLLALGLDPKNYKKREAGLDARRKIFDALKKSIRFNEAIDEEAVLQNSDMMDAVVCALAGRDFLCGNCVKPPKNNIQTIRKEGWIWFRRLPALSRSCLPA